MTPWLTALAKAGIAATVVNGDLRLDGPAHVLTPERLAELSARKADILAALAPVACPLCTKAIAPTEPETWWGLDRVHYECGIEAWRKEWKA